MSALLSDTEERVLKIIREKKLISRADVARECSLSKPVVSSIVSKFIEAGALVEKKLGDSTEKGGKRPILLSFVKDYRYAIGIDVGGTKIIGILTDLDGNVIKTVKASSKGIRTELDFIEKVMEIIDNILVVPREKVIGIGVGVPGTTDSETGIVCYMPAFELYNIKLRSILEEKANIPVRVGNDVTMSAVGEMWKGAAQGSKSVFLISLGTGTGSGLIINGKVYSGAHNMAGEVGYQVTDWNSEKSMKNVFGYLEYWFSGYSFEKKAEKIAGEKITGKEFFDRLNDNPEFHKIFTEGCEHLGILLSNVITLMDPETVVINGGIGFNRYDEILKHITPVMERIVPKEILIKIHFKRGALRENSVALGAVCNVQKELFMDI